MRIRPVSLVLVCLLASTMLSGCIDNPFDKDAPEPEAPPVPSLEVTPAEPGPDDVVTLYGPEGSSCPGCVELLPPGSLPDAPPPRVHPRPADQPVQVPYPAAGDMFLIDVDPQVSGQRFDSPYATGSEAPGLRFSGTPDLEVHLMDPELDVPGPVTDHEAAVVFQGRPVQHPAGSDESRGDERDAWPDDQYWTVSLHDRALVAREVSHLEAGEYDGLERGESRRVVTHTHARAAVAFELGADLWGRSLDAGDRFRVERSAAGYADPVATYDYTVRMVTGDGVVELVVSARDLVGATASWRLWIDDGSPYPHALQRLWVGQPATETTFLPFDVRHRTIEQVARGDRPLGWSGPPTTRGMGGMGDHHAHDRHAQMGDRFVPDVLDARLPWGVREAVDELFARSQSFSAFMARHPDRVLVDAALAPETTLAHGEAVGRLVWTLTFTDGSGDLRSWTLQRPMLHDGQVAGVTYGMAETSPPFLPDAVRMLRYGDVRDAWLAMGDHAYDTWRAETPDPVPNQAGFRLMLRPDGAVGGQLLFGHETPEVSHRLRPPASGSLVGGHVVQDLYVGDIVETVQAFAAG